VYATVRRYAGSDLAAKIGDRGDEVAGVMGKVSGLRAYYLIQAGADTISVTISDDESGGQESSGVAAQWIRENMPDAAASAPEISSGEVVLSV
jgi:hypothetical protein